MATKRKAEEAADGWKINWKKQERRPFRRSFVQLPTDAGKAAISKAAKKRASMGIELAEDSAIGKELAPPPVDAFEELGALSPWVLEALRDEGLYEPTALQAQALPIVMAGQNLVAVARSPVGQPVAYLVPCIAHADDQPALSSEDPGPVALVLVPTQALAEEVTARATALLQHSSRSTAHPSGLRVVNVSGGGVRSEKLEELGEAGAHIVVGTPNRVHDMVSKEHLSVLRVTYFVVDGADKMLEMKSGSKVRDLAAWIRPERHTLVFAASWPRSCADFATELCWAGGDAVRITVSAAAAAKSAGAKANGAKKQVAGKAKAKAKVKPAPAEEAEEEVAIEEE